MNLLLVLNFELSLRRIEYLCFEVKDLNIHYFEYFS